MFRSPILEVPSFFVVPEKNHADRFASSQKIVFDVLRSAQCFLKVNRISCILNKNIRIEANTSNLVKLKSCMKLANIGLKMMENIKMNPRIIVHSVPTEMTLEEIKTEVSLKILRGLRILI